MQNRAGQPVRGDDFFDREDEQQRIWASLEANHVLLLAPRRVGKTSLMGRLEETAADRGYQAVYLSVADKKSEVDFIQALLDAALKRGMGPLGLDIMLRGTAAKYMKKIRKVDAGGFGLEIDPDAGAKWTDLGNDLAEALARTHAKWLILMDELPVFVMALIRQDPGGERARLFLNWFRRLRQENDHVSWLLAGSIGLDNVVQRLRMGDTVNDLHRLHLDQFSPPVAHRFLQRLCEAYQTVLSEPVRQRMLHRVEWCIPYFLQLLFHQMREMGVIPARRAEEADVDAAFEALMAPGLKGYFDYWHQRLHEEMGTPDSRMAVDLLNAAAHDAAGASRQVLKQVLGRHIRDAAERDHRLRYFLDVLEIDGYLVEQEERYRFRSPLLRAYWLRRVMV